MTREQLKLDFNERSDYPNPWLEKVDFQLEQMWLYPDRQPLEALIAEREGLSSSQVFCSNGGDEAIYILMRIINENSSLILPLPAFSQYTWGIQSWQIDAVQIPPNLDKSIDIPALLRAIENADGDYVVITRPNNPTGEVIAEDDLKLIIETAAANQCEVFVDEAYIEFADTGSCTAWIEQYSNLTVLRTLSKAYGLAGARLGYILGSKTTIDAFKNRAMPFNVPRPTLALANAALTFPEAQQAMREYIEGIKQNRATLMRFFNENNIECLPSGGNFMMITLEQPRYQLLLNILNNAKISVRTFSDSLLANSIRITVPYQLDRLMLVLQRVFTPDLICMDMDGVLIDTSESYDQSIIATVKHFTKTTITSQQINALRSQGGFNNDWVLAQELTKQAGQSIDLDTVTDVFQSFYLGRNGDGLVSRENALIESSLVEKITQSQTPTFAVVTGRPKAEAIAGQQLIGLQSIQLKSDDDVSQSKPSPEGIKALKQELQLDISWMIGDTPDDIQAAKASDSVAIGIGLENEQSLYDAGADLVVDSINQLEAWL